MNKCITILSYRQAIELSSVKEIENKIITNNLQTKVLQHELPAEADLTQGRDILDKNFIFKSVSLLLLFFFSFRLVVPIKSLSYCR